jgi:hypothetical protein
VKVARELQPWLDDLGWANVRVDGMVHPMLDLDGWDDAKISDFINRIKPKAK